MDVKQLLIDSLESFGYPVMLQGSLMPETKYPDSFFTFWNNASDDESFYDNAPSRLIWDFDLNFYSNNPELVNSVLMQAKSILKQAGFIVNGAGYDVMSDEITHSGRGINLIFIEREA